MQDRMRQIEFGELLKNATITGLYIYPLKGGRSQSIDKVLLTPIGLEHDRELMAVTQDGKMCSMRSEPRLALITTTIGHETITIEAKGTSLTFPIQRNGLVRDVSVHNTKQIKAVEQHKEFGRLVSQVIGKPVSVVRMLDNYGRQIKSEYQLKIPNVSNEVGFADGGTLLLTAQNSADEVNRLIQFDTPGYPVIPLRNFRGNIEVDGFGIPFAEDLITAVEAGNSRLHFRWLCARCEVTTKDQFTGDSYPPVGKYLPYDKNSKSTQPLYSLAKHRTGEYWPGKKGALFGVNVISEFIEPYPVLETGMKLQIVKSR